MIMRLPITLDRAVIINYSDGSSESSNIFPTTRGLIECKFTKINGWDSAGNRVTNLVGYDGVEVLKICPSCHGVKYVTDFGYSGRYTNRRRDQSQCMECRSQY